MIGKTIAHYEISQKLGAGGMGEVYLATDTKLNRSVALKMLPQALSRDADARSRLIREAQAASRLNHPNILTVHAIEEADGHDFIVMEYLEGQPLSELIASSTLDANRILMLARQIAVGLRAAHEAGIVHRDIKPDNIHVGPDDHIKILDFGLAKLGGVGRLSGKLTAVGTALYMSPEQARGEPVDQRADLWSFGVVLHEMLAGTPPFRAEYDQAVIYAILNEEPAALPAGVAPRLQQIVNRCLQKKRDARYDDASSVIAVLDGDENDSASTERTQKVETPTTASIAVLPFADMSPAKDQEHFCDGITEELINGLAQLDQIHVVARTSVFAFKGKDADIREIGDRLGVRTVLEGSVRTSGTKLRIAAQLINVADGFHLWSETFDRDRADIFAIQDELAQTIVGTLRGRLFGESRTVTRFPTQNLDAYNAYLRGLYLWNKRGENDLDRSLECFRSALTLDPDMALAHVGVANALIVLQSWGRLDFDKYVKDARTAAERALALDSNLAEAHAALAMILRDSGQWQDADAAFVRALKLNPGYATAHQWRAIGLIDMGRPDDALAEFQRALRLDPLSLPINCNLGWCYYITRRFTDAVTQAQQTLELDPGYIMAHEVLFWAYLATQRAEKAVDHAPVWLAGLGGKVPDVALFRDALVRDGVDGIMRLVRDVFLQRWKAGHRLVAPGLVVTEARLGNIDEAFRWLERAAGERLLNVAELRYSPDFDPLRTDSRYGSILHDLQVD